MENNYNLNKENSNEKDNKTKMCDHQKKNTYIKNDKCKTKTNSNEYFKKTQLFVYSIMMNICKKKTHFQAFYLIVILLINELIYASTFNLFFYNIFGGYTNLIFSFVNILFICAWMISMINCVKGTSDFFVFVKIYFFIYLLIIIRSFYCNPWCFPFYLLFVFINFGFIINFFDKLD